MEDISQTERKSRLKKIGGMPVGKPGGEESSVSAEELELRGIGESDFSGEELARVWEGFPLNREGRDSEQMILKLPRRLDGSRVILNLGNEFQKDILNRFHSDLTHYLRKNLNNRLIEIVTEIQEEEREDLVYTNRDKFEYMMKINPVLKELQDKLGFDPDF